VLRVERLGELKRTPRLRIAARFDRQRRNLFFHQFCHVDRSGDISRYSQLLNALTAQSLVSPITALRPCSGGLSVIGLRGCPRFRWGTPLFCQLFRFQHLSFSRKPLNTPGTWARAFTSSTSPITNHVSPITALPPYSGGLPVAL